MIKRIIVTGIPIIKRARGEAVGGRSSPPEPARTVTTIVVIKAIAARAMPV